MDTTALLRVASIAMKGPCAPTMTSIPRITRRLAGAALAATAALAPMVTPAANAAPNGNIVTLGDSYTANPDQVRNTLRDVPIKPVQDYVWNYPSQEGCLQAPMNWPRRLGAIEGAPVADWSCTAETSRTMLYRLDKAIAKGDVNRNTRAVVIAAGMNDFGGFGIAQGMQPWNLVQMQQVMNDNIRIAKEKVQAHAPGAKIILAGMIAAADPKAPNMFCPVNVIPDMPGGFPLPALAATEAANEHRQRVAAAVNGIEFVPMRMETKNNSTCAQDKYRYVNGGIDTTVPGGVTMSLHPSDAGNAFIAQRLSHFV